MRLVSAMPIVLAGVLATTSGFALQADDPARREARTHYKAGEDLMQREKFDDAAVEFKAAGKLDSLMFQAFYNEGQCYMVQKRYVEAVAAYQGARESVERSFTLGERERLQREMQIREDLKGIQDAIRQIRSNSGALSPEHKILVLEERQKVLENSLGKGAERKQVPAEIPLALGSAYFRQSKLEDAEREYLEAVKGNPKMGPALNNLAVIYMLTGRFKESREFVARAEKAGFPVSPAFKKDLDAREAAGASAAK